MSSYLGTPTLDPDALIVAIESNAPGLVVSGEVSLGCAVVRVEPSNILPLLTILKTSPELQCDFFVNVTAVDWVDEGEERFEVVYHLRSLPHGHFVRVKAWVPEESPEVASVTSLWEGANFMEREVWDMYGIRFSGHPDLTRILMYEEFTGHPLRKDYPVQGKQPRIPLRAPEVENTARLMQRPDLVSINKRKDSTA